VETSERVEALKLNSSYGKKFLNQKKGTTATTVAVKNEITVSIGNLMKASQTDLDKAYSAAFIGSPSFFLIQKIQGLSLLE